ncbi:hypothetical protein GCM10022381_01110 [Leifsonia kafniensis]|uniref:Dinucleotide-utilizing enzyme n=1 Tax=Leifsonia kafniensis TaxID=475957 RepID=A0ABP7K066_9MICO
MSPKTSDARTKSNYSLAILWLASVVVGLVGYVLMTSSNSGQAELYTKQTGDYAKLFPLQSGSSLGATLIGIGVLGLLIALATHAVSFAIARSAATTTVVSETDVADIADTDADTVIAAPTATAPAVAFTAPQTTAPATASATASAAETTPVEAPAVNADETPSAPVEGDTKA